MSTSSWNQPTPTVNLGFINGSSILTLTPNAAPFGSANPNLATAEVNGLYETILGRSPDPTGGAAAVAYLSGGGSTTGLAASLMNSVEYDTDVVASYYKNFLGRVGNSSEISDWVKLMQKGATEEYVASQFLSSVEYSDLHPSATDFVQSLYENVLGREGAPSEVASWVSLLNSGSSRATIVAGFVDSTEADTRAVDGFYATFFARNPEPSAVSNAVSQLQSHILDLSELAIELAGSAEFTARAAQTVT